MSQSIRFVVALSLAVALTACGKAAETPAESPGSTTGKTPGKPTPNGANGKVSATSTTPTAASWTGTLEAQGPGIVMQGTHKLVADGKTTVLLKSAKVDLSKHEGKRVVVTGPSETTVEGNMTLVDVETLKELP